MFSIFDKGFVADVLFSHFFIRLDLAESIFISFDEKTKK
jgi:hypothetical protein